MENPKIIINTDDIKEKEILSSYWKFKENFKYEFSARDISKKYLINIVILSQLAKEKSHFNLICSSCECVILSGNISRSEVAFFDYVFEDNIFCEKCKKDSYKVSKAKNQLPPDIILKNMSIATNDKVWGNLDSFEFEALNVISKAQSVAEVYSSLKSINFNNPNEIPWETLNFLEEKYLIWMKRNPMQNIMEFYLDDRLKKI